MKEWGRELINSVLCEWSFQGRARRNEAENGRGLILCRLGGYAIMKKISIKELAKEIGWICGILMAAMIFENFEV